MQYIGSTLVLGGSFDPLHAGHLKSIELMLALGGQVVLAPTRQNPDKSRQATSLEHRLNMIRLVLAHEGLPVADQPEVGAVFVTNFPYTRTREFVDWWRETYGECVTWVVGNSDLRSVTTWMDWEFLSTHMSVLGLPDVIIPFHATDIRAKRVPPHPAIAAYIEEHRLY